MAYKKQPPIIKPRAPGFADFDEQLWPVNLLLFLFAVCLAAVSIAKSDFKSPHLLANGWFHLSALAVIVTALAWGVTRLDRRVQRRTQLGVLLSLLVHLWLCMLSYNIYLSAIARREIDAPETVEEPAPITLPDYTWHDESTADASDPTLTMPIETPLEETQPTVQRQDVERPQARPSQPEPESQPVPPAPPVIERAEMSAPRRAAELVGGRPSRQEQRLADTSEQVALPEVREAQERTLESPLRVERHEPRPVATRPSLETALPASRPAPAALARRISNENPLESAPARLARKQFTAAAVATTETAPERISEPQRSMRLDAAEVEMQRSAPAARLVRRVPPVRESPSVSIGAPARRAKENVAADRPQLDLPTPSRLAKATTRADAVQPELAVPQPAVTAAAQTDITATTVAPLDRAAAALPNQSPTPSTSADSPAAASTTTFRMTRADAAPDLPATAAVVATKPNGSRRLAIASSDDAAGEASPEAAPAPSTTAPSTEPPLASLGKQSGGASGLTRQDNFDAALPGMSASGPAISATRRQDSMPLMDAGPATAAGEPAKFVRSRVMTEAPAASMPAEEMATADQASSGRSADVTDDATVPAPAVGGDKTALADLGSERQAAALSVLARAPADIGGLSSQPSFDVGVPDRLARPESDVAHLNRGRFILKRSGVSRAAEMRVQDVAVPGYRQRDRQLRQELARQRGGSEGSEKAVEMGLDFLARHQNVDGSWSLQKFSQGRPGYENAGDGQMVSDTAATGLAMLAFLGAGYTHTDGKYRLVVTRGLNYLLGNQRADGDLFLPQETRSNLNVWLYSHGIAAIALCEAYGMTRDPSLKQPAQRALDFIVAAQHPVEGGWRYAPRQGSDTSVSGWQLMALKSGELAGLRVPAAAYAKVGQWLDSAQAPGEREQYVYRPKSNKPHQNSASRVMTAEALLMRQYSGWRRDHRLMTAGADFLMRQLPEWSIRPEWQRDSYYWYYGTQVMFQMGGQHWDAWNERLRPLLVEHQEQQGLFAGSWEPLGESPDRWGREGGRIYVTAMHLLMLEVYYRHLPLYRTLEE